MAIPPARPRKPWYRTWWAITLAVVVGLCGIGTIGAALNGDADTPPLPDASDAVEDMNDMADDFADAADDLGAVEFEGAPYFEPVTHSGTGADVVALPEGASEGFVTASHDGASNFIITALDENNNPTADMLVNAIGAYDGSSAFGLLGFGGDATSLEVMADGTWEITVSHFRDAPVLELPAEGKGDAVFKYLGGDAATWHLTHNGESNFIVGSTSALMGLVNEIGSYEGNVPVTADPAIITIMADGGWSIAVE